MAPLAAFAEEDEEDEEDEEEDEEPLPPPTEAAAPAQVEPAAEQLTECHSPSAASGSSFDGACGGALPDKAPRKIKQRRPPSEPRDAKKPIVHVDVSAEVQQARKGREKTWSAHKNREDFVIDMYTEYARMTDQEWLVEINRNVQSVMETNAELMEVLAEQDMIVKELRSEKQSKQREWDASQQDVAEKRQRQAEAETKHREVASARLRDERKLRERGVALHEKLEQLSREKARLEEQRRSQEAQIAQMKEKITKLQQTLMALKLRKTNLESSPLGADSESLNLYGGPLREEDDEDAGGDDLRSGAIRNNLGGDTACSQPRPPAEPKGTGGRPSRGNMVASRAMNW